jgi:hypothetical protein
MKLNKQQKVIIGVFGLASLGLMVDRVFLLPKGAGAGPMEDASSRRTGLILTVNTIPEESTAGTGLKDRLNERLPGETLDLSKVRDAFTPVSDWLGSREPNDSGPTVENLAFKQKYRLQAIMFQGEVQAVFMNDDIVRKGDIVDGYELVELNETSATFAIDGIRTVLLLD